MGFDNWKRFSGGSENVRSMRSSQAKSDGPSARRTEKRVAKSRTPARFRKREKGPAYPQFDEAKYRAESDMRVLSEAAKVLDSPQRVTAAKRVAMEQAKAAEEAAAAVLNIKTTKGE